MNHFSNFIGVLLCTDQDALLSATLKYSEMAREVAAWSVSFCNIMFPCNKWCSVTPYLESISKTLSSNNSLWIHEKKPTWIWYTCGSPNIFRIPSSIITQDMKHSELSIYHKKIILFTLDLLVYRVHYFGPKKICIIYSKHCHKVKKW